MIRRLRQDEVGDAMCENGDVLEAVRMYGLGFYTLSEFVERMEYLKEFVETNGVEIEEEGLDGEREAS